MAVVCGAIFSLLHAVATITLKANQVVIGVVINLLALGVSVYLVKSLFNGSGQTENLVGFGVHQVEHSGFV